MRTEICFKPIGVIHSPYRRPEDAPRRPNPIGITVARLVKVRKDGLEVSHVDMVDGSPLLDIKPYISEVGAKERVRLGWLAAVIPKLGGCSSGRNRTKTRACGLRL